ncbi:MAG TPA: hypothetical protein PLY93_11750 [Turneriella sp.]|nr:hypothetical protein [Turneriella sp.]
MANKQSKTPKKRSSGNERQRKSSTKRVVHEVEIVPQAPPPPPSVPNVPIVQVFTAPQGPQATHVPMQESISGAPFMLAIAGFIFGLPGILCLVACGTATSAVETSLGATVIILIIVFNVIPLAAGLIGGIISRNSPKNGGILMLVGAVFELLGVFFAQNLFGWITAICYVIGGVIAMGQKKMVPIKTGNE